MHFQRKVFVSTKKCQIYGYLLWFGETTKLGSYPKHFSYRRRMSYRVKIVSFTKATLQSPMSVHLSINLSVCQEAKPRNSLKSASSHLHHTYITAFTTTFIIIIIFHPLISRLLSFSACLHYYNTLDE